MNEPSAWELENRIEWYRKEAETAMRLEQASRAQRDELALAVHRLNGDWQNEECGDPKCGDGCEHVRTVKRILDGVLGTSYLAAPP